ncbi:MAG: PilZ domain-containing protein [Deltaproteobacteria bacterium]|nr:PilZ domain-containing protein [Deltaproteobacteria bacterium]
MTHLSSNPPPVSSIRKVFYDRHRRNARRRPMNATVEVLEPAGGTGVTINASAGGLRVAVDCLLRPGDMCVLTVNDEKRPKVERARVIWTQDVRDGCIAGLQLLTAFH